MQALEFGAKFNAEQLHLEELGIATLTAFFVNSNRDPKKGSPVKASDFFHFAPKDAKDEIKIPGLACDAFFSLIADRLLPNWVLNVAPIDLLRSQKSKNIRSVVKPRAWLSENLLLILPRVKDGQVEAALAFSNNASGLVELYDVDSQTRFIVQIEKPQIAWMLDAEFEVAL